MPIDKGRTLKRTTATQMKKRQAFGEWMRERRQALGMSQGDAAAKAGIDRPTWSDYERARWPDRMPSALTLYGIARALDWPWEEVFQMAGVRVPTTGPLLVPTGAEGEALLKRGDSTLGALAMAVIELQRKFEELEQGRSEDDRRV